LQFILQSSGSWYHAILKAVFNIPEGAVAFILGVGVSEVGGCSTAQVVSRQLLTMDCAQANPCGICGDTGVDFSY
jgi:hypothetical protein